VSRIFEKDLDTKVYGEYSKLSSQDFAKGLRLNPLDLVKEEIRKDRAPFIVLKPLVESQNILQLLGYFEESRALWVYRDYRDVAMSNLTHFGNRNGIDDLRPIVANEPNNWRSEGASENVREIVARHFSENMSPYDAAVLFWFARNSLFFESSLDVNPDVLMCRYEDLVSSPVEVVRRVYNLLGQNYPGDKITAGIHSQSLRKGESIGLAPEIDHSARVLLDGLDKAYHVKNSQAESPMSRGDFSP
jgi:hypothetical protein